MPAAVHYLLQHAGGELHGLVVLLLQHVHVEVIQEVIPVIIHPALIQLGHRGRREEEGGRLQSLPIKATVQLYRQLYTVYACLVL
jgi:hypothetical protein